uniref:Kurtoxin-like I n=1 Tax=Parabuthus granulatus TaxID=242110 RepID=KURT1_PARGR|nr:RecName: Full=Kurtoxin-like I; Short=KLI; AltName: Full=Toxin PgKL1 [Parabuthus granulatus]
KIDGYPVDNWNCKRICWYNNKYCYDLCKGLKADSGYCWGWTLSCYCEGLPDNARIKRGGRCN